jgi:hypothetical protein
MTRLQASSEAVELEHLSDICIFSRPESPFTLRSRCYPSVIIEDDEFSKMNAVLTISRADDGADKLLGNRLLERPFHSTSPYFPLYILYTDLLASLLIIVKPFTFRQVDCREFTASFYASCKPFALQEEHISSNSN